MCRAKSEGGRRCNSSIKNSLKVWEQKYEAAVSDVDYSRKRAEEDDQELTEKEKRELEKAQKRLAVAEEKLAHYRTEWAVREKQAQADAEAREKEAKQAEVVTLHLNKEENEAKPQSEGPRFGNLVYSATLLPEEKDAMRLAAKEEGVNLRTYIFDKLTTTGNMEAKPATAFARDADVNTQHEGGTGRYPTKSNVTRVKADFRDDGELAFIAEGIGEVMMLTRSDVIRYAVAGIDYRKHGGHFGTRGSNGTDGTVQKRQQHFAALEAKQGFTEKTDPEEVKAFYDELIASTVKSRRAEFAALKAQAEAA